MILVSAASDLAAVMPALSAAFERETGWRVSATMGASGLLAQQILNGAPVDVFASADASWVDRLEAAQRTLPGTRAIYARGGLALVLAGHSPLIRSLTELADPAFRRIAMANPAVAPYGRAARAALERSGAWPAVEQRIVIAENVRQAVAYVTSGNVDAAVVARSLVPERERWFAVPPSLHAPLVQEVVVIRGTVREQAARRFVEFITAGGGRDVLIEHNFALPDTLE